MPLKLVRRTGSPYWYIRGSIRGVRISESTGTGDREEAEEVKAKRAAELFTETIYGRSSTATFSGAALSYQETGGSSRFLEPLIRHFKATKLASIGQAELDKAARALYPRAAPATLNRQFYTPASAVLYHAARRGWCPRPMIERPGASPDRIRWLTPAEADRLVDAASPHLKPLLIFLFYTGARAGEALWLDWRNVELSRRHVSFPKTKNGDPRGVPIAPRLFLALANLPHREGAVFRRPDGLPYEQPEADQDTSAGTRIKTAFWAACRRAGIDGFRVHDCRHTWATWHYAANRDLGALQRLGGWKSVRMVMRYTHVNVAELKYTMDRLPGQLPAHLDSRDAENL